MKTFFPFTFSLCRKQEGEHAFIASKIVLGSLTLPASFYRSTVNTGSMVVRETEGVPAFITESSVFSINYLAVSYQRVDTRSIFKHVVVMT